MNELRRRDVGLTAVAIAAAAMLVLPSTAYADRRDLYLLLDAAPAMLRLSEPTTGASAASQWGGGAALTAYYGLTHEWHLGFSLRVLSALNAPYAGLQLQIADGSRPPGTLYEDVLLGGGGVVLVHRFDLGFDLAPVARLEVGGLFIRHYNIGYFVDSTRVVVPLPDIQELVFSGRAHAGVEYRFFQDRLVAGIGISAAVNLSPRARWALELPITLGYIW